MYLRDFAEQRGVKPDTVAAYIREHEPEFAGHTWMEGKQKVLDDVAVELLGKKYPMPKPIQVIQDAPVRGSRGPTGDRQTCWLDKMGERWYTLHKEKSPIYQR